MNREFHAVAAQVIPVLLLALIVDTRLLLSLQPSREAQEVAAAGRAEEWRAIERMRSWLGLQEKRLSAWRAEPVTSKADSFYPLSIGNLTFLLVAGEVFALYGLLDSPSVLTAQMAALGLGAGLFALAFPVLRRQYLHAVATSRAPAWFARPMYKVMFASPFATGLFLLVYWPIILAYEAKMFGGRGDWPFSPLAGAGLLVGTVAVLIALLLIGLRRVVQDDLLPAVVSGELVLPVRVEVATQRDGDSILVSYEVDFPMWVLPPIFFVAGRESESPGMARTGGSGEPWGLAETEWLSRTFQREGLRINGEPAPFNEPLRLRGKRFSVSYRVWTSEPKVLLWLDSPFVGTCPTDLHVTTRDRPDMVAVLREPSTDNPKQRFVLVDPDQPLSLSCGDSPSSVERKVDQWMLVRVCYVLDV